MTGNHVAYAVTLVIAILSLFGAVGLYYYPTYKAYKEKKIDKEYVLKNKIWYISSLVLLLVAFVAFIVQFYLNEFNVDYIVDSLKTTVDGFHYFLMYCGAILSALTLYVLASMFVIYFFFENSYKKENKRKFFWTMFATAVVFVLCFYMFTEGNAPYLRYPFVNRIYFGSSGVKLVTAYTGYNWAPIPTGDSWGFSIAFYALAILSGALIVFRIDSYQLKVRYGVSGLITTLFLIGFPTGIIGCRAWYVIGNWQRDGFDKDFSKIFRISDGGLAIMGALLAVVVCIIYLVVIKYQLKKDPYTKMNYLVLLDILIPSILLAQGIGRWGNFFNNEVHGNYVEMTNWMWIPTFIRNNMHFSNAHTVSTLSMALEKLATDKIYVPLFYVESLTNIIGYLVLEIGVRLGLKKVSKQKDGTRKWYNYIPYILSSDGNNLGYYLVWYGLTRMILEPLRDSNFNMGNDNQWSFYSAIGMVSAGVLIVICFSIWQVMRDHGHWIWAVKDDNGKIIESK